MDGSGVDTSMLIVNPDRGLLIAEEVKFVFNLTLGFFAVVAVGCVVFFILAVWKSVRGLQSFVILFIIATSIPITVVSIFSSQNAILTASGIIRIENLKIDLVDSDSVEIVFDTSVAKMAYLEYSDYSKKDARFILPMGEFDKKMRHRFFINNVSTLGGEVTVVIDDRKYGYFGEPIRIKRR